MGRNYHVNTRSKCYREGDFENQSHIFLSTGAKVNSPILLTKGNTDD